MRLLSDDLGVDAWLLARHWGYRRYGISPFFYFDRMMSEIIGFFLS